MFAGSFQGVTQTLPLAIYAEFDVNFDVALTISALLVVISAMILLAVKLRPAWTRSESTSPVPLRSFVLELALEVGKETVALVGPSGAGKTTVLRAIAGLARPERGRISCGGQTLVRRRRDGSFLPPEERSVGLVFQEYALFPHLDVRRNVAFGGDGERRRAAASGSGSATSQAPARHASRAASASGSRSPAPSPATRLSCSSTSRCRRSTRTRRRGCAASCTSSSTTADCRRSSSRTTSRTRRRSPTGSASSSRAGSCSSRRPRELVAFPADSFVASLGGANLLQRHRAAQRQRPRGGHARRRRADLLHRRGRGRGRRRSSTPGRSRSRSQPASDSALNHIGAEITSLVPVANRVRVGLGPLVAEVTASSVERLQLAIGQRVIASFKAAGTRLIPTR